MELQLINEEEEEEERTVKPGGGDKGETCHTCTICHEVFCYKNFKEHKKSPIHQLALKKEKERKEAERKRKRKESDKTSVNLRAFFMEDIVRGAPLKQKYWIRKGTEELLEQHRLYINTLTSYIALRYALNGGSKDFRISVMNQQWMEFGDIVVELLGQEEEDVEIHAIQCKQISNKSNISSSALTVEKGKFSIKRQCEMMSSLRKRKHYNKTFFKIFTLSDVTADEVLKFDEAWSGKEGILARYKKASLIDTTDDSDNICIFKILNTEDKDQENDLAKFSIFINQKKIDDLTNLIRIMIEDRFDLKADISKDFIKFIGEFFRRKKTRPYCFKLTKKDVLLKIPELILDPHLLFPECLIQAKTVELWNDTLANFDVVVVKNQKTIGKKIFMCLNHVLPQIGCTSLKIDKSSLLDERVKSELFDDIDGEIRYLTPSLLYKTLWKTDLVPLVLVPENDEALTKICKAIKFLKMKQLCVKFILIVDFPVGHCDFSDQLTTLLTLEDVKDEDLQQRILTETKIEILSRTVTLEEIVAYNEDFLKKVTPDAFLNMLIDDFSFKNVSVPIEDDVIDNTFVLGEDILEYAGNVLKERDKTKSLEYLVSFMGAPTTIQVPPDI